MERLYPKARDAGANGFPNALAEVTARAGLVPASSLPQPQPHPQPAAEPAPDPKVPEKLKLPISTEFLYRGRRFTVTLDAALSRKTLDKLCDRLDALGAEPPPLAQAYSPEGSPICSRHHVSMREREKQGDSWWSHKVVDPAGQEHYCKGRAGKDSPGWDLP